jgi:hypothetical protein|uniref:thiol oxidase n=1 Tax=viral metagenome TaxID=1070528 RepID=A0A6C0E063_9ZZZZ
MALSIELWGSNIWSLFHGLSCKISEDKFLYHKDRLIYIVKSICSTLPCPDCSTDATAILNTFNFNTIKNKEDFKVFLFNFHNIVNKKLKKPLYEYSNLDIYNNINMNALYTNFRLIYLTRISNPRLMGNSLNKKILYPKIMEALLLVKNDLQ